MSVVDVFVLCKLSVSLLVATFFDFYRGLKRNDVRFVSLSHFQSLVEFSVFEFEN